MLKDFTIAVSIKDKSSDSVKERIYPFTSFCRDLRFDLMRVLGSIEKTITVLENNKPKEEWDPKTIELFQQIRKDILNTANAVERIPKTIRFKGNPVDSIPTSEFVAELINSARQR